MIGAAPSKYEICIKWNKSWKEKTQMLHVWNKNLSNTFTLSIPQHPSPIACFVWGLGGTRSAAIANG